MQQLVFVLKIHPLGGIKKHIFFFILKFHPLGGTKFQGREREMSRCLALAERGGVEMACLLCLRGGDLNDLNFEFE